jgi:transposase
MPKTSDVPTVKKALKDSISDKKKLLIIIKKLIEKINSS